MFNDKWRIGLCALNEQRPSPSHRPPWPSPLFRPLDSLQPALLSRPSPWWRPRPCRPRGPERKKRRHLPVSHIVRRLVTLWLTDLNVLHTFCLITILESKYANLHTHLHFKLERDRYISTDRQVIYRVVTGAWYVSFVWVWRPLLVVIRVWLVKDSRVARTIEFSLRVRNQSLWLALPRPCLPDVDRVYGIQGDSSGEAASQHVAVA